MRRSSPQRRGWFRRTRPARNMAYEYGRDEVMRRCSGRCETGIGGVCTGRAGHAHHILRRSHGGPDHPDNLLGVCAACHGYIHDHPAEAYENGWMRRGVT